jgi:WD40 repeat protein
MRKVGISLSLLAFASVSGYLITSGYFAAKSAMRLTKIKTFEGVHKGFFSRDGTRLALMDKNHADVIEVATGRVLTRIGPRKSTFLGVTFSPDGGLLATVDRFDEAPAQVSIKVTLWDATTGKEKLTLPVIDHDWRRVADDLSFSPDGQLLASNIGGIIRLWNVTSGNEERRFLPPDELAGNEAERALLSPDGKSLAVYFRSRNQHAYQSVCIWNLVSGQEKVFQTEIYLDWTFSADSRLLALTALLDKGQPTEHSAAEIWNVTTGRLMKVIEVPHEWRGAYTIALSPDSRLLAIGGFKKVGIFSVERGELLVAETHHRQGLFQDSELPNQVNHVEFSQDGKLLLTSGNDDTVKLWRVFLG